MKFQKVLDKQDPQFHADEPHAAIVDTIFDCKLYNNIAVYIMKPGIKGNFKMLAPLVNNGTVAPSWAIRIYYLNNEWTLHFAPHPNIAIDFNLQDQVQSIISNPDTNILGHNHVAMIVSPFKTAIENAVNDIIAVYRDKALPSIENQPIYGAYQMESSTARYRIPSAYKSVEEFDDETYKKYLIIIKKLMDNPAVEQIDRNEIIRISKKMFSSKVLNKRNLTQLNKYVEKYIDQHSKIKIALQYLLSSKNN